MISMFPVILLGNKYFLTLWKIITFQKEVTCPSEINTNKAILNLIHTFYRHFVRFSGQYLDNVAIDINGKVAF